MISATGPLGSIRQKAVELLSQCESFRNMVGAANESEALRSIHSATKVDAVGGVDWTRAFAVVERTTAASVQYMPRLSGNIPTAGSIRIMLSTPSQSKSIEEADLLFCNYVDDVVVELLERENVSDSLCISALSVEGPYMARIEEAAQRGGDHWQAIIEIDWSPIG